MIIFGKSMIFVFINFDILAQQLIFIKFLPSRVTSALDDERLRLKLKGSLAKGSDLEEGEGARHRTLHLITSKLVQNHLSGARGAGTDAA